MATQWVVLCAGAADPAISQLSDWINPDDEVHFVGIDRGAWRLINAGYLLDVAVGDFDSVSPAERQRVEANSHEFYQYPSEKDDTDAELGLALAMERWPEAHYLALGFLGEGTGRLDHLLANIWLAHQPRYQAGLSRLILLETQHQARFYLAGQHTLPYQSAHYLSIISLTPVTDCQIEGAKYHLAKTNFAYPRALISNEFVRAGQAVRLEFTSGIVLVMWVNRI